MIEIKLAQRFHRIKIDLTDFLCNKNTYTTPPRFKFYRVLHIGG